MRRRRRRVEGLEEAVDRTAAVIVVSVVRVGALCGLADLELDAGRISRSRKWLETALAAMSGRHEPRAEGHVQVRLAELERLAGDHEEALRRADLARGCFQEVDEGRGLALWHALLARVARDTEDAAEARAQCDSGEARWLEVGSRIDWAEARAMRATMCAGWGEDAAGPRADAAAVVSELGLSPDARLVRILVSPP